MPPQLKRACKLETTWIREYARTYLPSEAGFSFAADDLRSSSLSLVALRHVLGHGSVVQAEKLEASGAVWIVEGMDNDGKCYRLTLKVISEELDVTLLGITEKEIGRTDLGKAKGNRDNGYDAA